MGTNTCGKGCGVAMVARVLLIIGGINWGLVGLSGFIGTNLNVVHLIFGSMPTVEWIIYILVGIAGVISIFGCKCKTCQVSATSNTPNKTM